jgi:REP element-mobilizing transposase RayT
MINPTKKSHNVSHLLYHLVCPAKYRRLVFRDVPGVDKAIKDICIEIQKRYDIHFVEIGIDEDHVHFLVQSVPVFSPTKITQIVKSITAREVFKRIPDVKALLWGGEFWTKGFYINTVGYSGDKETIANYIRHQDSEYQQLYSQQPKLF